MVDCAVHNCWPSAPSFAKRNLLEGTVHDATTRGHLAIAVTSPSHDIQRVNV